MRNTENKPTGWKKWLRKYRVVLLDEASFEERFSMVLSRFNVSLAVGTTAVVLILATILLVAYTPLREYIPGYASTYLRRSAISLDQESDSLMTQVAYQEAFIRRFQAVINNDLPADSLGAANVLPAGWSPKHLKPTDRELALRQSVAELEAKAKTVVDPDKDLLMPLVGTLIEGQRSARRNFGIKISGEEGAEVQSMKDGTVLAIEGTPSLGFTVLVQHQGGGLGRYGNLGKANRRVGDYVKQGDVLGNIGEAPEGEIPFVSIQYWLNGESLNLEKLLGL
jgi:murein DD-endopeptidase MepM/ murein hydrolase activator NlpD